MIAKQIQKPVSDGKDYADTAVWCNRNQCHIEDKGDFFEVVRNTPLTLEEIRKEKRDGIETLFQVASEKAHIVTSSGHDIDANEVANRNIAGLLIVVSDEGTMFRIWDNRFVQVNRNELLQFQKEIVLNSQNLYAQKWRYEQLLDGCTSEQEIRELDIHFVNMSFYSESSDYSEEGTGEQ